METNGALASRQLILVAKVVFRPSLIKASRLWTSVFTALLKKVSGSQAQADEVFAAIGQQGCGEVMHHKRDVSLREDRLRTSKAPVSRLLGSLPALVINLLEGLNVEIMAAHLATFADKFPTLIQVLTQQLVL